MRVLMTGGSGVLGSASIPLLRDAGHTVDAPGRTELDLFDPEAVAAAVADKDAVLHLATRIPPPDRLGDREAWRDTDRLRAEATPILVDAALAANVKWFLFPSIAFVYPEGGPVDESTPVADEMPGILLSALEAERQVARFDGDARRGVVLRLGVLYGPTIDKPTPNEHWAAYGATVRIEDAGRAIAAAAGIPGGVYNVVGDGERVSNALFKATTDWRPEFSRPDAVGRPQRPT
jgi:nucleoside-diphosphate-sugar epimerase